MQIIDKTTINYAMTMVWEPKLGYFVDNSSVRSKSDFKDDELVKVFRGIQSSITRYIVVYDNIFYMLETIPHIKIDPIIKKLLDSGLSLKQAFEIIDL